VRTTRTRQLLVLLATWFALAMLGVAPASADVDCADLKSRSMAQSYFEGRSGDLDRLDSDADGQACEATDPHSYGKLSLPGFAVLVVGALVVNGLIARRQARNRDAHPVPVVRETAPAPRVPVQRPGAAVPVPEARHVLVRVAPDRSLEDLAHALCRVPLAKRRSLVELYAVAHHATPQDILGALAVEVSDVGLQRWAESVPPSSSG
jgi:hypothetical protein